MKDLIKRTQATIRRRPMTADAALALTFAAVALIALAAVYEQMRVVDPSFRPPGMVPVVLSMLGVSLPLAWRRLYPLTAAGAVVVALLLSRILVEAQETSITVMAGSLAIYSAALHGHRRLRTPVLTLCFVAILTEVAREVFFAPSAADLRPLAKSFVLTYNVAILALPWVLGVVIRSLKEHERELADRAVELDREREENARQAVFAERVRIAREMHDVLAHHVSVMGVQAGAARRVMERQPEKAIKALSSIELSSRLAVAELHRLLGFLRRDGEADGIAPQPGLAQLDDLVAQAAEGELTVDVSIEGDPRPLPATLEVSAYRVIQEALTNTRKHSSGVTATVTVRYGLTALEVEVVDSGTSRAALPVGKGSGHGLIGMRERATLHGGHLRAGPRSGGGFVVHASFPLGGPESSPELTGPEQ